MKGFGIIVDTPLLRRISVAGQVFLLGLSLTSCSNFDPIAPPPAEVPRVTTLVVPDAFTSIGAALAEASFGDTVSVRAGTYVETNLVLIGGVYLKGDGADSVTIDASDLGGGDVLTIAKGAHGSAAYLHGIAIDADFGTAITVEEGVRAFISGCRISDSYNGLVVACFNTISSVQLDSCEFDNNGALEDHFGSPGPNAIFLEGLCGCYLYDSTFTGNKSDLRGAIFCRGDASVIEAIRCTFAGNISAGNGAGAAISAQDAHFVYAQGCHFENNQAATGGAVAVTNTDLVRIEDSDFRQNHAGLGGAVLLARIQEARITNDLFVDNTGYRGGALNLMQGAFMVSGCFFIGNGVEDDGPFSPQSTGGAILADFDALLTVEDSTFYGNWAYGEPGYAGSGACIDFRSEVGYLYIQNSILAGSPMGESVSGIVAVLDVDTSDVYGNVDGNYAGLIEEFADVNGNISADPLFCDPDLGDFRLSAGSPCMTGNGAVRMGAGSSGCE